MKFGHLIEDNMRNVFLEKLHTKCGGETNSRPFSKKIKIEHIFWKLSIFFEQYSKVLYSFVFLYDKLRSIEIYWN